MRKSKYYYFDIVKEELEVNFKYLWSIHNILGTADATVYKYKFSLIPKTYHLSKIKRLMSKN